MAAGPLRLNWGQQKTDDFWSRYESWEQKVHLFYRRNIADEHYDTVTKHSLSMQDMLSKLPRNIQQRLMSEYETDILRLPDVIAASPNLQTGRGSARAVSRIRGQEANELLGSGANPLALLRSRVNLQWRPPSSREAGRWAAPMTIPSSTHLRALHESAKGGHMMGAGQKILVIDTETGGLASVGGIRQITASMMRTDASGKASFNPFKPTFDEHYRTAQMQHGYIPDSHGRLRRLQDALQDRLGFTFQNAVPGSGDDYTASVTRALKLMDESHVIVGHNIGFDLNQIFGGLRSTGAYQDSIGQVGGLAELFDQVQDKVLKGKIVDTQSLMYGYMPELKQARELRALGEKGHHSMENITLQTNLLRLIEEEHEQIAPGKGRQRLERILGISGSGFMHDARVDVPLEAYLYKYISTGQLQEETLADPRLRSYALHSWAPTPMSRIKDIKDIHPDLVDQLVTERAQELGVSETAVRRRMARSPLNVGQLNVTPLEQEIWAERSYIAPATVDARNVLPQLGRWRDYSGVNVTGDGFLNRVSTLFKKGVRPKPKAGQGMRQALATAGIGYAGLSDQERTLTNALAIASGTLDSDITRTLRDTPEGMVARISDDLGISKVLVQEKAYVSKSGRNVSMPLELMQHMEGELSLSSDLAGAGSMPMLRMSPFQYPSGAKGVNFMHTMSQEDAASAAAWLRGKSIHEDLGNGKSLFKYGIRDDTTLETVAQSLETVGTTRGVNLAFLNGQAGEAAHLALTDAQGGMIEDEAMKAFKVGLDVSSVKQGMANVGAVILDRFRDVAGPRGGPAYSAAAYASDYAHNNRIREGLQDIASSSKATDRVLFSRWARAIEAGPDSALYTINRVMDKGFKHLPAILGGAAVLGGGYYLWKKHKEQNLYDETLDKQPIQSSGDYASYRHEMGLPAAAPRRMVPLDTAGVVGNMDRLKMGHTDMSNGKYDYLFAGVMG